MCLEDARLLFWKSEPEQHLYSGVYGVYTCDVGVNGAVVPVSMYW